MSKYIVKSSSVESSILAAHDNGQHFTGRYATVCRKCHAERLARMFASRAKRDAKRSKAFGPVISFNLYRSACDATCEVIYGRCESVDSHNVSNKTRLSFLNADPMYLFSDK